MTDDCPKPEPVFNWIKGRDLDKLRWIYLLPDEDIADFDGQCRDFIEKNKHMKILRNLMDELGDSPSYEDFIVYCSTENLSIKKRSEIVSIFFSLFFIDKFM